jgi:hypothetical protein
VTTGFVFFKDGKACWSYSINRNEGTWIIPEYVGQNCGCDKSSGIGDKNEVEIEGGNTKGKSSVSGFQIVRLVFILLVVLFVILRWLIN